MSQDPKNARRQDQVWCDLMKKSQAGDKVAYQQLLRDSSRVIKRFLISKVGDTPLADDLLQETLIAIHKARHTYDPSRAYVPWMLSLSKYKYVDYLRKWARTTKNDVGDEGLLNNLVATNDGHSANEAIGEELRMALDRLPERQRVIVELLKIEGLSIKEVAAKLGASESAIKVSAHRGYKALRKYLEGMRNEI